MSEQIFAANGLYVTAVAGPANGESDRGRLEFQITIENPTRIEPAASARLDKFDVAELRLALTRWQQEHAISARRRR